jgi:hypothetical protein
MRILIGLIFIIGGVCLGLYLGLWVLFIGGIVQIVEAAQADPVSGVGIAFGIVRIAFASFVGWLVTIFCVTFGTAILED